MAAHIFGKGQKLFVAQFDLTPHARALSLKAAVDARDATVMLDTTRKNMPGLRVAGWDVEMFFDGPIDGALHDLMQSAGTAPGMGDGAAVLMTFLPDGQTEGNLSYFARSMLTEMPRPLVLGDGFMQSISGVAYDGGRGPGAALVSRGVLAATRTVTAAGNGPAQQLGALADDRDEIHLGAHVTAISGTSPVLTLIVQSDDNAGFTTPTTRATATAVSAIGAIDMPPIVGPITDTYWRVTWTLTGTTPSATFVASLAKGRRAIG